MGLGLGYRFSVLLKRYTVPIDQEIPNHSSALMPASADAASALTAVVRLSPMAPMIAISPVQRDADARCQEVKIHMRVAKRLRSICALPRG